jgi:hypothetical protein
MRLVPADELTQHSSISLTRSPFAQRTRLMTRPWGDGRLRLVKQNDHPDENEEGDENHERNRNREKKYNSLNQ